MSDNVTQIQPYYLGSAQAAAENDGQHCRIAYPDAGVIGLAGTKQRPYLLRGRARPRAGGCPRLRTARMCWKLSTSMSRSIQASFATPLSAER
jgi:hypothetical protein